MKKLVKIFLSFLPLVSLISCSEVDISSSSNVCDRGAVGINLMTVRSMSYEDIWPFVKENFDNQFENIVVYQRTLYSIPFTKLIFPRGYQLDWRVWSYDPCFFDCTLPSTSEWIKHVEEDKCMRLSPDSFEVGILTPEQRTITFNFSLREDNNPTPFTCDIENQEDVLSYYSRKNPYLWFNTRYCPWEDPFQDYPPIEEEERKVVEEVIYQAIYQGIKQNIRPFSYDAF